MSSLTILISFCATSTVLSPMAVAANVDGTHVNAPRTDQSVSVPQPGCKGTVAGNRELQDAKSTTGAAMTTSGNPYVAGAGGALIVLGHAWPSHSTQDFASCAVSCALIPKSAHVLKVETHFKGSGTLNNAQSDAQEHRPGVGIADVTESGLWNIGTGWYGVRRLPLMTSEVSGNFNAQCIEFRNWSNTEDRIDIHAVVITDQ